MSATNPKVSEGDDPQNASKVIMHLPGGEIIHVSENQNVGVDLVKIFEEGNTQVTELQKLPGGIVYYAIEESDDKSECSDKEDNHKVSFYTSFSCIFTNRIVFIVENLQAFCHCQ